ncbi:oligopeptide transport ATP-binding protein AppF [Treponema primitia ZAS-2]|uniref:Oligopeptide transport ATP-binding protein AppF n=1 Tax=Treponema primitia (strain ATCC BAA-887 / DSM 12427 / ZAS-2) TaxID=545694 RepID=F5YJY4_TREPZ|nr:oligopeptide/dipeptide ABC transporter ATP-binding protein [Treponema primitia]AEF85636.1 oligopeptide transport ATP-binding protein AppF [Treponema primitia ZAS-2]
MSKELLQVENLKKYFHTPAGMLHAVDDVSFTVSTGATLGIVGESGCGKSTLGRTILRLHEPTSGRVFFNGYNILHYDKNQLKSLRRDMQIIFQDPFASLNPRMTVSQTISEALIIQKLYSPRDREGLNKRSLELMDMVGLAPRLVNTYPHELDGGRRQRIGIARVLALNPKLIICDEPVSALDVSIQAQILNLMQDLQEELGFTYLFITHDLSVVKHLSDDILVMYLGQMVEKAPAAQLFEKPLHPYTQALLSAIPVPDPDFDMQRTILKGELTSPIEPAPGCRFAKRCPRAQETCVGTDIPFREVGENHFAACTLIA